MGLKRDESKHISCQYEGHENDCPKDCNKCAISIKTDGDIALAQNNLDLAIKQYKRAIFVEPKFAEAWVNMGNAYGMKSEYSNAISSLNKAITIDPTYGKALFGKAITLKNQGKLNESMIVVNEILEMYDDSEVEKLKDFLIKSGVQDTRQNYPLKKAVELMTDKAYDIIRDNNLLDANGAISTEKSIYCKEDFARQIYSFCKKRYDTLGKDKVWSESILAAFYGSLCITLLFYKDKAGFNDTTPFDYLLDHVNLEEIDRYSEKLLDIRQEDSETENLWNLIYGFVSYCNSTIERVEEESVEAALIDATESAYVMGMLFGMRHNEKKKEKRASLDDALKKLADSTNDYNYTPPERSAMCYSIRMPEQGPVFYKCGCCGKTVTIDVDKEGGKEQQTFDEIFEKYQSLAQKFTELGYPSEVKRICNDCARQKYPSFRTYHTNNMIFSLIRKDCGKTINSYPAISWFEETPYKISLAFLNGADTLQKLSEVTDTKLSADDYLKHIHNVLGDISNRIR